MILSMGAKIKQRLWRDKQDRKRADVFADDIRKAEEAGMNGHISKPVDIQKPEEALRTWIK